MVCFLLIKLILVQSYIAASRKAAVHESDHYCYGDVDDYRRHLPLQGWHGRRAVRAIQEDFVDVLVLFLHHCDCWCHARGMVLLILLPRR